MRIITIILCLLLCFGSVAALDITALAKGSGDLHINKNVQTKIESALGIDFSTMTGTTNNNVQVTIKNILQIGSLYIIIADINTRTYTIIVPAYKVAEYIK